jgi:hypothetical protein
MRGATATTPAIPFRSAGTDAEKVEENLAEFELGASGLQLTSHSP